MDAGWYPDPADGTRWRWWDGQVWTDRVSEPTDPSNPEEVARQASSPGPEAEGSASAPTQPGAEATTGRASRTGLVVAGIAVGAILAGGTAVALRPSGAPTAAPSPTVSSPTVTETTASPTQPTDAEPPDVGPSPDESVPSPAATVRLAPPLASGIPAEYDRISYEGPDLGFTLETLTAAVRDLGHDPYLGWAVTPDLQQVCMVSAEVGEAITAFVGGCHTPVPEPPTAPGCHAALNFAAGVLDGDPEELSRDADLATADLADPVLAGRIEESAGLLDRRQENVVLEFLVTTASLAEATCGQLNRSPDLMPASRDWDGARYDVGEIVTASDGTVQFDRWGYLQGGGPAVDGADLEGLVLEFLRFDDPFTNVNPQLRTFSVAPYVRPMRLVNNLDLCDAEVVGIVEEPRWELVSLADVTASLIHAVQYDGAGQVVSVWGYDGC